MAKKKTTKKGGAREGAGRPNEGKAKYTVSLTSANVEAARKKTKNLSKTLDELLAQWLKKK